MIFATKNYIAFCEAQMKQQRDDFLERLAEKNTQIRQLRVELAATKSECERMNSAPLPHLQSAGTPVSAAQPKEPVDWQGKLNKMLKEEEDGIRSRGRIQEHQPSADDGPQEVHGT